MKKIGILFLAAATAFTSYAPAQAMPVPSAPQSGSNVELVHHKPWHHGGPRRARREVEGARYTYHNGYRGYRYRREGYRRHSDGWWYPLAAFGAGVIIGNAIAAPPRYVEPRYAESQLPQRHVSWCYDQYRSYRAWDNSYQPYGAPRQQCYSPYY
ncbi:BA14K family protein [Ensifer sp. BR816]|uniref:BA14K family protein n=1 Tax=Rhizobium sp. (strain BR816) TaxID=1057002 RepID=UPI000A028E29|nr:BA14K family protein [Ensifer sp. BR816]